ncbi:hypothetical protein BG011_009944 [Mortierella polycephala]|uniref:Uncharacterized protein n=1 Tax=Mortierella polycephala TaxID=41804 RepID=A0A9P6QC36_9FUNG|nr:hypothetical protein BG011_009944 [Mortierella polycephala]
MSGLVAIYVGTVAGIVALLSVVLIILYRKYKQDLKDLHATEPAMQEQTQHAVDMTMPPVYDDHQLDPVCIYEHELPPDVLPTVQPILVHSASDDHHVIPPEEDPLASSSPSRGISSEGPAETPSIALHLVEAADQTAAVASTTTLETYGTADDIAAGESINSSQASDVQINRLAMVASPQASSPASSIPRFINQEMLNLARVPSPPSYHVLNRVVDRSPFQHSARPSFHQHSHSSSDIDYFRAGYQENPSHQVRGSNVGNTRIRSYTISHTTPQDQHQHSHVVQGLGISTSHGHGRGEQSTEEDLPVTPRYSLEFPSHVPHQDHLDQHQHARAMHHALASSSTDVSRQQAGEPIGGGHGRIGHGPGTIAMHERSHSQPNDSSFATSWTVHSSLEEALGQRAHRQKHPGMRARASTLGESSKLLMHRVHSLLGKSSGSSSSSSLHSYSTPNESSENIAALHLQRHQRQPSQAEESDHIVVGMGIDQGRIETPVDQESGEQEIVEQETEDGSASSPFATEQEGQEEQEEGVELSLPSVPHTVSSFGQSTSESIPEVLIHSLGAPVAVS